MAAASGPHATSDPHGAGGPAFAGGPATASRPERANEVEVGLEGVAEREVEAGSWYSAERSANLETMPDGTADGAREVGSKRPSDGKADAVPKTGPKRPTDGADKAPASPNRPVDGAGDAPASLRRPVDSVDDAEPKTGSKRLSDGAGDTPASPNRPADGADDAEPNARSQRAAKSAGRSESNANPKRKAESTDDAEPKASPKRQSESADDAAACLRRPVDGVDDAEPKASPKRGADVAGDAETEAELESDEVDDQPVAASEQSVNRSAALISGLVIVSRLTGFLRTWAQAHALGVTIIASCYSVANNLPNQLYELVIGGMLVTAFLPVYLAEKAKGGRKAGNAYASNLSTIVLVLMGIVTLVCIAFAAQIVWTQSFSADAQFDAELAQYFFRFFAIEVLLYSLSSVFSGVLNAEREYVWSSAAPILNNFVVTASFIAYSMLAVSNPGLGLLLLALGNPLGVLVQVIIQLPAMWSRGIRLRPRIDLKDPAIKDTLSIGIPSLVVMLGSFVTVSVMTSSSLEVTPVGASVSYYARLWYTLPYSVLAVPVTTTMFTELSHVYAAHDEKAFCKGVTSGTSRILFLLVPFMLFLVVFAVPLVTLLAAGSFGSEGVALTSTYLQALSVSLPAYGVCMYLQKVFSSLREMAAYAMANVVACVLQVAVCLLFARIGGLTIVALSSLVFFLAVDLYSFAYLKRKLGRLELAPIIGALVRSLLFGTLGALAGMAVMWAMSRVIGPLGESAFRAVLWCIMGGIPALVVCFGLQILLKTPESSFFRSMVRRR